MVTVNYAPFTKFCSAVRKLKKSDKENYINDIGQSLNFHLNSTIQILFHKIITVFVNEGNLLQNLTCDSFVYLTSLNCYHWSWEESIFNFRHRLYPLP